MANGEYEYMENQAGQAVWVTKHTKTIMGSFAADNTVILECLGYKSLSFLSEGKPPEKAET